MLREFSFTREPRLEHYRILIREGRRACTTFSVIERRELGLEPGARTMLDALRPECRDENEVSAWPGTTLLGATAIIRHYGINDRSTAVLATVDGLFDWRQPARLEDLILWRSEGDPWLVSTSHEQDAFLRLTLDEWADLRRREPHLAAILAAPPAGSA